MGTSIIHGNQLLINNHPFYVCGGEIQYFRLAVKDWRDRLMRAKDGGLNTISSCMPWYYHEMEEGRVDLTGATAPERNLRRFLELAAELDLKVIARPGPFMNAEFRCGGIPRWLFEKYPDTMSRRSDGRCGTGRPLPAEGEPIYRDHVRRWYRQVIPLIAEFDIHCGGPVIFFQADNELSAAWSFGLLNSLYDPTILTETWPRWLENTYKTVKALGERYNRTIHRFTEVDPPRAFPASVAEKRMCVDWMDFKRWFFADWGATLARWAIEDGIKVPIMFNEPVAGFYEHGDHAGFGSVLKEQGLCGVTACHTYSPLLIDLEGATGIAMAVETTKSSPWGGPPIALEVNATWFMPRLSRSEINWEGLLRLGLAHGLMGTVVYPYVAERADLADTIEGPEYFEPTCVDLEGRPTASFAILQRFNRFVRAWERELAGAPMAADISIAYSPGLRYLDFLGAPPLLGRASPSPRGPGGDSFSAEPVLNRSGGSAGHDWLDGYEAVSRQTVVPEAGGWRKMKDAMLLLTRLNMAFDMVELTHPNRTPGHGWIIVPCTGSLDRSAMDYLLAHLDGGGKILFFPTVPVFDLDGVPDRRLADRVGVRLVRQVRPAGGEILDYGTRRIDFGLGDQTGVHSWIFVHECDPPNKIDLAWYVKEPVVTYVPVQQGGVMVAGLDIAFTNYASLRLWKTILQQVMEVSSEVFVTGNYYHTILRKGGGFSLLTVTNLTGRTGPANIHCLPHGYSFPIDLRPHESRCLVLNADLAGKRKKLLYTTSEIVPLDEERNSFELWGPEGTLGELAFTDPVNVLIDGRKIASSPDAEGGHRLRYRHGEEPLRLDLTIPAT